MSIALTVGMLVLCSSAAAQHVVGAHAGTIDLAIDEVTVDGQAVHTTATKFPQIKDGQTLRTGNGWVEVLLAPGVFLRTAARSALRMISTKLEDTQVELLEGTALVEVVETTKGDRIQIRRGNTTSEFRGMGLYRFDLGTNTLRVYGGEADISMGGRMVKAGRGKAVHLGDRLTVSNFNPKKTDGLQQWAARRSFDLFASSPEAQLQRTNWEMTESGWSWNRDFQARFYAPQVARRFFARRERDEREKAAFQQTEDMLRAHDQQVQQQSQQIPVQEPAPASGKK